MARFVKGDIIVGLFPYSNATGVKSRPALVLSSWLYQTEHTAGAAYLLCAISASSKVGTDPFTFELPPVDIIGGSLSKQSYINPSYLFSSSESAIIKKIGTWRAETFSRVLTKIRDEILAD